MAVALDYATDLFDETTMSAFGDRFGRMLSAVAAEPDAVIGDVPLLSPEQRATLLDAWNEPGTRTSDHTLVQRFADQAVRTPDAIAVTFGDRHLPYRELAGRVNRLARELLDHGVGPDSLVAVAMARTDDLVVALLAVQQAGGGYLPLDLTYPADRLEFMLADASPVVVLVSGDHDGLPSTGIPVIDLEVVDLSTRSDAPVTDEERTAPLRSDNLAYVIYTSGSTGRPKGVQVPHRTVLELFENTRAAFEFDGDDVWTLFHSYAFDFSVWELWGPLLHGGRLVVVDHFTSRSPEDFHALLLREQVTVLNQTPSAFYQLAEADRVAEERGSERLALRYVVFGGEALDLRRLAGWYLRHADDAPRLVNMYGITETTVHVSHLELDSGDAEFAASLVGRAIPGLGVYVLDPRLQPVPAGVPGEMYVRGDQLTRGYLGRSALTSGRFVADPFGEPGSRMYRTGDIARWSASGQLEYVGRSDSQVQLRGFRIELGEIEAALTSVDGVAHAVAVVRTDERTGDRLVGYVVPRAGAAVVPAAVLDEVGQFLTGYMVPDSIVVLDALPLTPNGKLDKKALPAPVFLGDKEFRAPSTPAEVSIAEVFADVLGIAEVGVDDSFFALGGDSIVSIQLVSRAKARGIVFTPRQVFEQRTVAGLAAVARVVPVRHRHSWSSTGEGWATSRSRRSCDTWSSAAAASTATPRPSRSNCPRALRARTWSRPCVPSSTGTTFCGHPCVATISGNGCSRRRDPVPSTSSPSSPAWRFPPTRTTTGGAVSQHAKSAPPRHGSIRRVAASCSSSGSTLPPEQVAPDGLSWWPTTSSSTVFRGESWCPTS